jgi:hypothetical protein
VKTQIKCYVRPLAQQYADGLERVELEVCSEFISFVPNPVRGQRIPITLLTPQGRYQGGLRGWDDWVYVCPDLVSEKGSRPVSLAKILKDNDISPRDTIPVQVADRNWEI